MDEVWDCFSVKIMKVKFKKVFCLVTLRADSSVAARVPTERLNPLRPNISIYILHTFPYTFLKGLIRRNCLTINGFCK